MAITITDGPLPLGGMLTKAGAPTSGVYQKITATVVGTVTLGGNASLVLTAAGMTGSPITLSVALALNDTATQSAVKFRTALSANAVIAAFFTVGGTGADVTLERTVSAANDATMNLAYDNDTCTGLTGDATSTATTAGVLGNYHGATAGMYVIDTTNSVFYMNTGDTTKPVWTLQ